MGIRETISRGKKARTIQKLYNHWLEEDTSSTDDVSDDSHLAIQEKLDYPTLDEYDFLDKQSIDMQDLKIIELDNDSVSLNLPARYVLQGVIVVSLLLIMLSVMFTILITRSCS